MDECGPLWTTLAERLDVPVFQGPAWARTWLEHLGGHAEPWIVVCEGPDPFVWPLAVTRNGPFRVLRSLGEGVSDYLGPIGANPREAVRQTAAHLAGAAAGIGYIDLKCVALPTADSLELLRAGLRGVTHRVYERCPFLRTDGTFASYLEGQKKKFRANWKRTVRRTEEQGKVEIGIAAFDDDLFAEIESVERESWKWAAGSAFLSDRGRRDFLRSVLSQPALGSEIWTCRIDGELAAFAVAFTTRTTRHYYLPSFRSRYSDVGTYLLGRIAEATFASDLGELDLLQGDESYKLVWATGERPVYEIAAPVSGALGWPAVVALRARWRLAESPHARALRARFHRMLDRGPRTEEAD